MKKIALIVAYDDNGVIGDGNNLPAWKLKDDMAHFKKTTTGNIVIMGRKNWDSIPEKFRPLPERKNIVMTRQHFWDPSHEDVSVASSLWQALQIAEESKGDKIFIIGGGEIYKLAIDKLKIDEVYITQVTGSFEGSVYFPHFDGKHEYECLEIKTYKQDDRNSHDFVIKKFALKQKSAL